MYCLLNRTLCYLLPALVEGVYLDPVVCVLLQDFLCVFISVEGVHEDQGHVCVVSLVQVLWGVQNKQQRLASLVQQQTDRRA